MGKPKPCKCDRIKTIHSLVRRKSKYKFYTKNTVVSKREPDRCKSCGKIVSGNMGRPNQSGFCTSCSNNLRDLQRKKK